jgi:hypothetical protein
MMKIKKILLILIVIRFAFCAGLGVYSNGNERIPLTAQAWALGNAVSANPDYAIVWQNPAKLAFIDGFQMGLGGSFRTLDRNESFLSGEYKIPNKRVGVGSVFSYKGIAKLDSLRKDGVVYEQTSYTNITTKMGCGIAINRNWAAGFCAAWYYSKIPIGFNEEKHTIETSRSSTVGGLSFLSMYKNKELSLAFGVRDIFSYSDWSYSETPNSPFVNAVCDTMPLIFFTAAEYGFEILDSQKVKIGTDFNGYLLNSFFEKYENAALSINGGLEWSPNDIISFRTGIRDILCNRNFFRNRPQWRIENNPRLSFGIGVNLESIPNWKASKKFGINYAIFNSGAGMGLEHSVDMVWKWYGFGKR